MLTELEDITDGMLDSMAVALQYYGFRWSHIKQCLEFKYKVKFENALLLERKYLCQPQTYTLRFKSLVGDEKQYLIRIAHKYLNNPTTLWFEFNRKYLRRCDSYHVQQWALKLYSQAITSVRTQQSRTHDRPIIVPTEISIRFIVYLMNEIPQANDFFFKINSEMLDFQEFCNFNTKWKTERTKTKVMASINTQEKLESLYTTILMINQLVIYLNPQLACQGKQIMNSLESQAKMQKSEFYFYMYPVFKNFQNSFINKYIFQNKQDQIQLYLYYLLKPKEKPIFLDNSLNHKEKDYLFDLYVNLFISTLREVCKKYKTFTKTRFHERIFPSVVQNLLNDLHVNTTYVKLHTLLLGSLLNDLGNSQERYMTGIQVKTVIWDLLDDVQAIRELDN